VVRVRTLTANTVKAMSAKHMYKFVALSPVTMTGDSRQIPVDEKSKQKNSPILVAIKTRNLQTVLL
jgi:hypothetical protein